MRAAEIICTRISIALRELSGGDERAIAQRISGASTNKRNTTK
jgi:hypothetical protein